MACPMYEKWIGDKTNRNPMYRPDYEKCTVDNRIITNESWYCLNSCDKCYMYQHRYPRRGHCPDPPRIRYVKAQNSGGGVLWICIVCVVGYMLLKYFRIL